MRCVGPLLVVCAATSLAHGEDLGILGNRWPGLPEYRGLTLEQQIADRLSELGNFVGDHMTVLSHEMVAFRVNGRAQRARLLLGGGDVRYLQFKLDSDWHFAEGKARIVARIELAVAGRQFKLELPDMEMMPETYRDKQLVHINVPLLERRW